jgi:uncharacterized oxidoreductase
MDMNNNTILITGGGSGIGRGLAEAFHKLGNQVIISGRRTNLLDDVTAANRGMKSLTLDIENPAGVKAFAAKIIADFPKLNAVIHNAGIARMENLKQLKDVSDSEAMVATNVLGPIRLNAALLPHLLKRPKATIMAVSSGLAFVPMAASPSYSATKAFLHSYTLSPTPASGDECAGDRAPSALRSDRARRFHPGNRPTRNAPGRVHRRCDGHTDHSAGCEGSDCEAV